MQLKYRIKENKKLVWDDVVVQTHCPRRKIVGLSSGPWKWPPLQTVKTPPVVHQHPTQDGESGFCSDGDSLSVNGKRTSRKQQNPIVRTQFLSAECKKFCGRKRADWFLFHVKDTCRARVFITLCRSFCLSQPERICDHARVVATCRSDSLERVELYPKISTEF